MVRKTLLVALVLVLDGALLLERRTGDPDQHAAPTQRPHEITWADQHPDEFRIGSEVAHCMQIAAEAGVTYDDNYATPIENDAASFLELQRDIESYPEVWKLVCDGRDYKHVVTPTYEQITEIASVLAGNDKTGARTKLSGLLDQAVSGALAHDADLRKKHDYWVRFLAERSSKK